MDYRKLQLSIAVLFLTSAGSYSVNSNERAGPLWLIQMGNKENMAASSRAMISYNGIDSSNYHPQIINDGIEISGKMMNCLAAQAIRNSLLPLVELQGKFYYFEKYFKANYFKATQFCKEHGMDLLSIETGAEHMEIVAYLKKHYPKMDHIWTSGTDAGEEGAFVWLSTGKSLNFTNWGQGLPDNSGKVEHCLEIYKSGVDSYLWNDRTCNTDYNFICEVRE